MSEPDRFDCHECGVGVKVDEDGCCTSCGRDAIEVDGGLPRGPLRNAYVAAAESSALERAAQFVESGGAADISLTTASLIAARIRALIPPAAAPAAEPVLDVFGRATPLPPPAPAADLVTCSTDTDEHHGTHRLRVPTRTEKSWCLDPVPVAAPAPAQGAEVRIAELKALVAEANRQLAALAARAAPPEREGT